MKGNQNNGRRNGNSRRRKEAGTGRPDNRVRGSREEVRNGQDERVEVKKKFNDPEWYMASDQLAKDLASFSFGTPTGVSLKIQNPVNSSQNFAYNIPGIMSIPTVPVPGYSIMETSAVNVAMRKFFRDIRKGNTGTQQYDPPDLMLYILAMDSAYSWIATLCRLYGLARTYSVYNRYYGDALCMSQIFHPDIQNELAWLRGFINKTIVKLNQFAVPAQIPLFKRHWWMYSNVYMDDPSPKSQLYMYIPAALYVYDELTGPGHLVMTDVTHTMAAATSTSTGGATPVGFLGKQDIINITAQILNPLLQSQDINIISGDVVKFWDKDLYQLSEIPEDFSVVPAYSEEVLSQIHNTVFIGRGICTDVGQLTWQSLNVIQATSPNNGGYLICNPFVKGKASVTSWDKLCDMYKLDATPGDVLVATRNMVSGSYSYDSTTGEYISEPRQFGSDLCLYALIGVYNGTTYLLQMECAWDSIPTLTIHARVMRELMMFTQAPYYYYHSTNAPYPLANIVGQVNNYRLMTRNDLDALHECSIMSLLGLSDK